VGLGEGQAVEKHGRVLVGRANFGELARGQISGAEDGLLKIVCHAESGELLGVHAAGETASDLVHLGQVAMMGGLRYEAFIDTVFNFPTFAEAYRVAALDILGKERVRRASL
jgi:NAD(P) transhydrogenase